MMKQLLLSFLFFSFISSAFCQTLYTYGTKTVTTQEFLKAYNKNKTDTTNREQALREYLDLYINFKLKVQAAMDMHMDTLPSLKADLQNFRSQIEDNYLKDEKKVNELVDEAFMRSQKDIHVVDFFIPVNEKIADTVQFFKAVHEISEQLKLNNADEILQKITNEGISVQKNDLGFITVFTLPYEYENIIYNLKPGESSTPYRTKKGWYVFKNVEQRHAVGKIKLSQILFALPLSASPALTAETKRMADSIYNELKKEADFGTLAREFSDDKMTYMSGGVMPEFGVARYDPSFEKIAFSLTEDNEISKPFQTAFGFHILKRISASPVPPDKTDAAFMYQLKQEVLKDSRVESAQQIFLKNILPKIGFKKYKINEENLWKVCDSSLIADKKISIGNINGNTILFSFNDNSKVKVSDWISFLRHSNKVKPGNFHEIYKKLFPDFVAASAISNYRKRLVSFNLDFKNQLQEFKEGNTLFEVMQRKVWEKASADSAALLKYYQEHQQKYFWEASADAVLFTCANEAVAKHGIKELENGKSWKEVMEENPTQMEADSGRYELSQIPVNNKTNFIAGLITDPVINKNDESAVFTKIIKLYPGHLPRNFQDARGLVINDYQNYLEQKWLQQLKEKYPVKVNEKVFQTLPKQN